LKNLKKRLIDHKRIRLADGFLLHKINEIGSGPVIEMLESLIDEGNSVLLNIGESILKDFFPNFEDNADWVDWCGNWKDDTKKEKIILKSLGLILSKLINYKPSEVRDQAIALIKYFAIRNGIDYDAETNWKITELLDGLKELNITHRDSYQDPCLQAVDFVCRAIYRCYNRDDPKYFEMIKNNCIVKHEMWKR